VGEREARGGVNWLSRKAAALRPRTAWAAGPSRPTSGPGLARPASRPLDCRPSLVPARPRVRSGQTGSASCSFTCRVARSVGLQRATVAGRHGGNSVILVARSTWPSTEPGRIVRQHFFILLNFGVIGGLRNGAGPCALFLLRARSLQAHITAAGRLPWAGSLTQ
jgi:hypothetical protein